MVDNFTTLFLERMRSYYCSHVFVSCRECPTCIYTYRIQKTRQQRQTTKFSLQKGIWIVLYLEICDGDCILVDRHNDARLKPLLPENNRILYFNLV